IRLALLSAHYRQPLDITRDGLKTCKQQLDRLYGALRDTAAVAAAESDPPSAVLEALEDDLNTPLALTRLHELAGALNKAKDTAEEAQAKRALLAGGALLGLLQRDPEAWFKGAADEEEAAFVAQRIA